MELYMQTRGLSLAALLSMLLLIPAQRGGILTSAIAADDVTHPDRHGHTAEGPHRQPRQAPTSDASSVEAETSDVTGDVSGSGPQSSQQPDTTNKSEPSTTAETAAQQTANASQSNDITSQPGVNNPKLLWLFPFFIFMMIFFCMCVPGIWAWAWVYVHFPELSGLGPRPRYRRDFFGVVREEVPHNQHQFTTRGMIIVPPRAEDEINREQEYRNMEAARNARRELRRQLVLRNRRAIEMERAADAANAARDANAEAIDYSDAES